MNRLSNRFLSLLFTALALVFVFGHNDSAHAYEEKLTLGVDVSYAAAPKSVYAHGLALGVDATWGVHETWAIGGRVGYAWRPLVNAPFGLPDAAHEISGLVEATYVLDIVQLVPFAGLGLGTFGRFADGERAVDIGPHMVLGVDWLHRRREVLFGADLRVHWLPLRRGADWLRSNGSVVQLGFRVCGLLEFY